MRNQSILGLKGYMSVKTKTATVKGQVYDEKGRTLGGVKVALDSFETTTLFDGSYSFRHVQAGPHKLEVAVEGYRNTTRTIGVKEGELANEDFLLEPEIGESTIYGSVFDGETGEPIKRGGAVYMSDLINIRSTPIKPSTGRYEFVNLPKGTFQIWASANEYDDEKKTVKIEGNEERREDFHLNKRKDLDPLWG